MNEKLSETVTARLSQETKIKLAQKATDKGITLGSFCGDILTKEAESSEEESSIVQKENQTNKIYSLLDKALERNSYLADKLNSKLFPENSVVVNDKILPEKKETKVEDSLIENIANTIEDIKEREKFTLRFKKMNEHRMKLKKDKSEAETILKCIKYCMDVAAFFNAG